MTGIWQKLLNEKFAVKIFLAAVLARLAIMLVAFAISPFTLQDLIDHSDAPSYIAIANYLAGEDVAPAEWDMRVFPGWSYFLALFAGTDLRLVCITFGILFSGLASVLFFKVVRDERLAWLFVFLSPTFLFQTCLGMGEAFLLTLELAGLYFHLIHRQSASGLLLGMAGITRPTALFIYLPILLENIKALGVKRSMPFVLCSAVFPLIMVSINAAVFGDLLIQLHQYQGLPNISLEAREALGLLPTEGSHFGLPLLNLVKASLYLDLPLWKQFYIWGHVAALATAIWISFTSRSPTRVDFVFRWWCLGNAIFILSTGEYWAFHSFDRYFVWALPAYAYFLARFIIFVRIPSGVLAAMSTAIALVGIMKF